MSDGSRTIKRIRGEVILGVVIGNVARDHSMIARLRVRLKVGFDPHMTADRQARWDDNVRRQWYKRKDTDESMS
jgi:hypothetical protein